MNLHSSPKVLQPPRPLRLESPGKPLASWRYPVIGFLLGAVGGILLGHPLAMVVFNFLSLALASITLFAFGGEFLSAIPRFAKTRVANMDTLISTGTLAAYLYSVVATFFPGMSLVPRWRTMMDPAVTICPSDRFTPSRFE